MTYHAREFEWHIIDPGLGAAPNGGHHISYNRCVTEELDAQGARVSLHGHRIGAPADGLEQRYRRVFRRSQYQWNGLTLRQWLRAMLSHFRDLRAIRPHGRPTILFFHSTTLSQLVPTLAWARFRSFTRRTELVVPLLRYRPGYPYADSSRRTRFCVRLSRLLLRGSFGRRVKFASDSASLAREYEEQLGAGVHVLPIPHSPAAASAVRERDVTIGYVGASRTEKGYVLLPQILAEIFRQNPRAKIVVQSQMDSIGANRHPDQAIGAAFAQLCTLEKEHGFRHIKHTLGQAEFSELIRSIDILLLPHQPEGYAHQTSGVFSDALAAGCIPIVTAGTWLAQQLASVSPRYRNVVDYSATAIAERTLDVVGNLAEYRSAYGLLSKEWNRANSAAEVISQVLALCENPPSAEPAFSR